MLTRIAAAYFAWFLAPLLLASVYRPIALWDYLTSPDLLHFGRPITWLTLIPNTFFHLLNNTFIVRPTVSVLYDLQTLVFGGEFWLWYCVKWCAFLASVYLVTAILRHLGCDWYTQAAIAALLLFHPARFTLMLHAPDGWLALGMCAQLVLLGRYGFEVRAMPFSARLLWLLLALFTVGAKEAGYVFQMLLAAFLLVRCPAAWLRLVPHAALIAFWTWRLKAASGRAQGFVFTDFVERLRLHAEMSFPATPLRIFELALAALAAWSLLIAWRKRTELSGQLILFCWLAAGAMLVFVSIPNLTALRYVIPMVYLAAVPLGIALQHIRRHRVALAGVFIVVFPIVMAGHIYRQELGYQDQFYPTSELLRRLEMKARQGYSLVISEGANDIAAEPLTSVEYFFSTYGPHWYGQSAPRKLHRAKQQGWPAQAFVMASYFGPDHVVAETGIDIRRIERVEVFYGADLGTLQKLTGRYQYIDRLLHRTQHYHNDTGAPEPTSKPRFYLYTVGAPHDGGYNYEPVAGSRLPGAF
ncbi:MAG: hypothetical protein JNL62_02595 [Bryobacterales bacterium]|nr:hypothetical protein [Bryobacterales bacterium]